MEAPPTAWDFVVDRQDLGKAALEPAPSPQDLVLQEGEALLEIERFALTANNITYGVIGDAFGYWRFFPATGEGRGRLPVWGFATVTRSAAADVPVGLRLYGYWPMSTHLVARLRPQGQGFQEVSPHRAQLPPTYNSYNLVPSDDGMDDHRALLRPLFYTSFLLDDFLAEAGFWGAGTVILSSASSKTAMGLAWLLRRRGGVKVVGLSSPANARKLEAFDLYDEVIPYARAGDLAALAPAVFVDFAGDRPVVEAVHTGLGDGLVQSVIVGATHYDARAGAVEVLPGPAPVLFFAPDHIRKRAAEWGLAEIETRFDAALRAFVAASPWLTLVQHHGPQALEAVYRQVLDGRSSPELGHIIRPL